MQARLARLRVSLRERGLDALVVSSLPNIRYLTGFSGSNALCIVTPRTANFLTDSRYAGQSRLEVRGWVRYVSRESLPEAAVAHRLLARCKTVGFEAHAITYAQFRHFKRLFPGIRFVPKDNIVEDMAVSKDPEELSRISRAVRISDRVFNDVLLVMQPGVEERDIAAEITYLHRRHGADRDAFEPIVASGPRGAYPHARPSSRRIERHDLVVMDFGCVVEGYRSDLTRTVCMGRSSRNVRSLYTAVRSARNAAVDAARPGLRAGELDGVARNVIRSAGYGRRFIHSLGHGLGLRVHERPRIAPRSVETLEPGHVITIEPGIYIPGFGGFRIEDVVVITRSGCRVLTQAPLDLTIV